MISKWKPQYILNTLYGKKYYKTFKVLKALGFKITSDILIDCIYRDDLETFKNICEEIDIIESYVLNWSIREGKEEFVKCILDHKDTLQEYNFGDDYLALAIEHKLGGIHDMLLCAGFKYTDFCKYLVKEKGYKGEA